MPSSTLMLGLRNQLATLSSSGPTDWRKPGFDVLDKRLGGLATHTLHEVYATSTHQTPTADGFGLALAARAGRLPLVWVCEDRSRHETGELYGGGLHEWGLESDDLLMVQVSDTKALLAAGEEALRSGAAGAVLMSSWGEAKAFTLTASRRLVLAAAQGQGPAVLVRAGARPQPSAAETRWSVEAAPSQALEARAPGRPTFKVSLLRSRAGLARGEWIMEWDRETRSFVEPEASGGLVSVSARRPAGVRAA